MGKLESKYQKDLRKRIEQLFPYCIILKNDEQLCQGIPDLTILNGPRYAMLEVKRSADEARSPEPNQQWYVDVVNQMGGFAAFIYPENEGEVLHALQLAFESRR